MTKALSGKTDYLLRGEAAGPSKVAKAEKLGTKMINEDDLLEMIRASNPSQTVVRL